MTIFYGREYAAHHRTFLVLILATAIYCVACMFTSAITSARCFRIQAPIYMLVAGSNALACARWVPAAGLAGGAAAMAVASDGAPGAGRDGGRLPVAVARHATRGWSELPHREVEVLAHVDP